MYSKRSNKIIAVVALCIAVVSLSVGFAVLSTSLDISAAIEVPKSYWGVVFENIEIAKTKAPGLGSDPAAGNATIVGNTSIEGVAAELRGPGDSITYSFDVVNTGDYTAKIDFIEGPVKACNQSNPVCESVTITLKYVDGPYAGMNVSENQLLDARSRVRVALSLVYSKTSSVIASNGGVVLADFDETPLTIVYIQA